MSCPFSTIFGEVGKGIHSIRLFDIAIIDAGMTVIVGYLISKYFKFNLWKVLLILFVLGIISHRLFCVRTTIDKLLFSN